MHKINFPLNLVPSPPNSLSLSPRELSFSSTTAKATVVYCSIRGGSGGVLSLASGGRKISSSMLR
jgi:hypothetical protein